MTRWTIFVCVIVDSVVLSRHTSGVGRNTEFMRQTDDPAHRPWADILFALGASRAYGVTCYVYEPVRPAAWAVCLADLTPTSLVVFGRNADHWVACLVAHRALGVVL